MPNEPRNEDKLREAMQNCAREPVHAPDAIQAHGCLVCFDADLQRVIQVSENVSDHLSVSAAGALAARPAALLGENAVRNLRSALLNLRDGSATLGIAQLVDGKRRYFHATAYRSNNKIVVEFEPEEKTGSKQLLVRLNHWITRISGDQTQEALLATLARAAREISGYDRTLVFQFDEDWHSHVMAEDRLPTVSSFLDHRFPASDIPEQVRALYFRNSVRSIPDAQRPPARLISAHATEAGEPLDLSAGVLRAVSPIHVHYLANMGLRSSTSFAILADQRLWGLMSLHAAAPLPLSPAARNCLQVLTQTVSQRLFLLHAAQEDAFFAEVRRSRKMLSNERGRLPKPAELFAIHGDELNRLFRSCGIALVHREATVTAGAVPERDTILRMVDWLREQAPDDDVWSSNRLEESLPVELHRAMRGCCGLLAVSLLGDPLNERWFLLFRGEHPQTQVWAGRPGDKLELHGGRVILSPYRSLELWRRDVRGHSLPWSAAEVRAGRDLGEDLAVLVSALEISELRNRSEQQNRALEKMNERLETMAHIDPLTNLWNRRRIEEAIGAELAIADREQRDFAILLFDIDYFKRINDSYGHDVGDEVLEELAGIADRERRGGDALGRWGGEEFVFTASGADEESALRIAERLRTRIADATFGNVSQVTVSVGISSWQPGDTRDDLIKRADQALYEAKAAGRNCTRIVRREQQRATNSDVRPNHRH